MKKFLCSLFIIFVLWFGIDRIGGAGMQWVVWHTNEHFTKKICKIVSSVDADILLLGTSRCENHYVPSIIRDSTGLSVYNAGISGSASIFFHYTTLSHVLRYHTPKVVVLDTGESEYAATDYNLSMLNYYAPHIGRCAAADSIFQWAGMLNRNRFSHLYRYHSLSNMAIARLFMPENKREDNGYTPIDQPPSYPDNHGALQESRPRDEQKIATFRRFINLCRQHHIQLVLSISPSYYHISPHYYDVLRAIAEEEHLPLFDYDTPDLYIDHPEYFYNNSHLWEQGARLFSQQFAHDLKNYLSH